MGVPCALATPRRTVSHVTLLPFAMLQAELALQRERIATQVQLKERSAQLASAVACLESCLTEAKQQVGAWHKAVITLKNDDLNES
jgi:hypothetical protein